LLELGEVAELGFTEEALRRIVEKAPAR
jgi:hypothetical protein